MDLSPLLGSAFSININFLGDASQPPPSLNRSMLSTDLPGDDLSVTHHNSTDAAAAAARCSKACDEEPAG